MGGFGSGFKFGSKKTEEDYRRIDMRTLHLHGFTKMKRQGKIEWLRNNEVIGEVKIFGGSASIELEYTHFDNNEIKSHLNYSIELSWSKCHLGGERPWFLCPNCNRRVASLYCAKVFICRHCLNLNYKSTREHNFDRSARKANKIRKKMGWEGGILSAIGEKPKGMHHKTYNQLMAKYEIYTQISFRGMLRYVGSSVD